MIISSFWGHRHNQSFSNFGVGVTHQIRVRFPSPSTWVLGSSCGKLRQIACPCRSWWRWHGCRFYLVLGDHPNFGAFVVDQLLHNWAERQGDAVVKFVTLVRMRDIFSTDWEIFSEDCNQCWVFWNPVWGCNCMQLLWIKVSWRVDGKERCCPVSLTLLDSNRRPNEFLYLASWFRTQSVF